ncbi:hypothetical protein KFL_013220020 [Klebsormidium nitens]|uniref:Replication origin-binding protein domain-containing protein n=1 Tax=Klebsormidium nitens TaxID=105231 RepID=A0A1Y1IR15_KLENI|nr:hypothetical protein KFL_013220020 [Klebsormidium nitens]|eukprot:GAQ93144.1 hypothetical protein KFL_013220020 [Klebsormidium nitens]
MATSLDRNLGSDSESLEAIVDRNIESEPDSASEANDGESLEGVEYDRLTRPNCLKARRIFASRNDDEGSDTAELAQKKTARKTEGTLRKAADLDADAEPSTLLPDKTAAAPANPSNHENPTSSVPSSEQPIRPLPPNSTIVHSETVENGTVQTVRQMMLGTFFFSKMSSISGLSCKDSKNGPQGFSKRFAALLDHKVEIRHLSEGRGYRSFGSYPDWPTAIEYFRTQPHGEEVLVEGRPCKPYLDMDGDGGLPEGETLESVIAQFQDAIMRVFAEDYDVKLVEGAFNWVPCDYGPGGKFSLHLIISTHTPQLVFRSNLAHTVDPQGAGQLARRLAEVLPPHLAELIDQGVYTQNWGIRLPWCSKPSAPQCPLLPLDPHKPIADSVITWLDDQVVFIRVPIIAPDAVKECRLLKKSADMAYLNPHFANAYNTQRCLKLLQGLHPTAFKRGLSNQLNFSWTDRDGEPCYAGHIHSGQRDILCIVNEQENAVFAKCSSERVDPATGLTCKEQAAHYLGLLYADAETWKAGAVEINMRYLSRDPLVAGPTDLHLIQAGVKQMTNTIVFNSQVNKLKQATLRGRIRSTPTSYNDLKSTPGRFNEQGHFVEALTDRKRHPDVICQFDSLPGLVAAGRFFEPFDLVIFDEIESILFHLSASTFRNTGRHSTVNLLVEILLRATKVIALDGHLGQRTFDFFTMNGIKCGPVVINGSLPQRPLEFVFVNRKEGHEYWQNTLLESLRKGKNCIVYSMSSNEVDLLERVVLSGRCCPGPKS